VSSPVNPLMGWLGQTGVNPSQFGTVPPTPAAPQGPAGAGPGTTNPYGFGSMGGGASNANIGENVIQQGLYRNALMPLFSQQMFGLAGPAGQYYNQLMNLGSPYYQQQQRASWENVGQQSQSAAAQARQQLMAAGAGYTPSGAAAGMFGGMGQAEAGNQAQAFLQNLFQNEQLQMAGAQGLAGLAALFNPAQLTGQTQQLPQPPPNTAAQIMGAIGSLLGGAFGQKGVPT
jgi:hypothetical protein